MQVFFGIDQVDRKLRNPVLTIGNFDGVHRGHQALFDRAKEWAKEIDGETVVMTFNPHPLEVLFPGKGPPFITTHDKKLRLIESCGIDVALVIPFSREFSHISAQEFVERILVDAIGVKAIVVGHDYRFGHSREGDIAYLKDLGRKYGFEVQTVSGIRLDDTVVSSTIIRQLIGKGEVRKANRLLGRFYEVCGEVVHGRSRGGRLLGFPTANILITKQAPPRTGVYAVQAVVDGKTWGGAANLGYNPTFGDTELSLEVHLLDFVGDLYGKSICIRFIDRLRNEKRFSGPGELAEQIQRDVLKAREVLADVTATGK